MPVEEQSVIEGWRGVMVAIGLRTPTQRAVTAFLASGALLYVLKSPGSAFRADGTMRPSTLASNEADATDRHFLLTPLAIGAVAFLFT